MILSVLTVLILLLSIAYLSFPSKSPSSIPKSPLATPGPILIGSISNATLDGLTFIPVFHLLPLDFSFAIPGFLSRFGTTLQIRIETSFSELVVEKLRIGQVGLRAKDVTREEIGLKIDGLDSKFTGNFALRLRFSNHYADKTKLKSWTKQWRSSGRISGVIIGTGISFSTRIVVPSPSSPSRISLVSSSFDLGSIQSLKLEGFGRFSSIVGTITSALNGTVFVRWPANKVVGIMLRESLEDEVMGMEVEKGWDLLRGYLEAEKSWVELDTEDRINEEDKFDAKEVDGMKETKSEGPIVPHFHLNGFLHGHTHLHSFPLPDFSPSLYRTGGTRALLQSFNMLTNEVNFALSKSSLETIQFERGELGMELDVDGGVLTVHVKGLEVVLKSTFEIFAETTAFVAWTTGVKKIGEKGISMTIVKATTLTFKFILARQKLSLTNQFLLKTASISPFTSIIPAFTLHTTPKLGVELVNALTKSLSGEIATASSFVVRKFVESFVRDGLQAGIDGVEEMLVENGIVLPVAMRSI